MDYGWLLAGLTAVALLAAASWSSARLRVHNGRLLTTLNNLPQGLCVWSPSGRLVLCNERYVQMYNLSPELTRPGVSLRDLIDHRIKVGTFTGNRDQYIADLLSSISKGKTVSRVRQDEGRYISISNRPIGDGGWVATHEDVTEQRKTELQRSSMQELESRRALIEDAIAGFRERVETVLASVSDSGQAMQVHRGRPARVRRSRPRSARKARSKLRARRPPTSPPPQPPQQN